MEKYSFFLFFNNKSGSLEFIEKIFKLDNNEVIVGKTNDFPIKKSLTNFFDIESFLAGWKSVGGDFSITEGGFGTPTYQINLLEIIDNFFPIQFHEDYPDRYITGELELFFACNHLYQNDYQVSTTANRLYRFSCIKNYADRYDNKNYSIGSNLSLIHQSGRYTIYNGPHLRVTSIGELPASAYSAKIQTINPTSIGILVTAFLRNVSAFSSVPKYVSSVKWKLRLLNHDVENYTFEI